MIIQKYVRRLLVLIVAFAAIGVSAQSVTVVEFYNKALDAHFISGRLAEQQSLDALPDFRRTGMTFAAVAAPTLPASSGMKRICRFYINMNTPPTSSHFYGREGVDCEPIQAMNLAGFAYEGFDFAVAEPIGGVCASGTTTVYRGFRAAAGGKTPNHRYTTSPESYVAAQISGYSGEGPVFCAMSATDVTPVTASEQKCGTFYYPGLRISYQSLNASGTPDGFERFLSKTPAPFNGRTDSTPVLELYAGSFPQSTFIIDGSTSWTLLGTSTITDGKGLDEVYYGAPPAFPRDFAVGQSIAINTPLTYSSPNSFGAVTQTGRVTFVGKEAVSVTLGTYSSTCKFVTQLVTTYPGTGQMTTSTSTNWVADNLGIVKTVTDVETTSPTSPTSRTGTTIQAVFVRPS